jgi:hypothetical protein
MIKPNLDEGKTAIKIFLISGILVTFGIFLTIEPLS